MAMGKELRTVLPRRSFSLRAVEQKYLDWRIFYSPGVVERLQELEKHGGNFRASQALISLTWTTMQAAGQCLVGCSLL